MKKRDTHHFFLGLFVLAGSGVIGTALTYLGADRFFHEQVVMETYIKESVNGLEKGSPVKFRGIPVGEVDMITTVGQFYTTKHSYALVRVRVDKDKLNIENDDLTGTLEQRIRNGLRVSLSQSGLTGGAFLETEYIADPSKFPELEIDWLPQQLYVPSAPSTLKLFRESLEKVLDNLARTDLASVVTDLGQVVNKMESSIDALDLKSLSAKTHSLIDKANTGVDGLTKDLTTIAKSAQSTLESLQTNVAKTLASADSVIGKVDASLDAAELTKSLGKIGAVLTDAQDAVKRVQSVAARTEHAVDGINRVVRGRNREIQLAISNLRQVLQNLNTLTGNLSEYPSLLILGNPPKSSVKK